MTNHRRLVDLVAESMASHGLYDLVTKETYYHKYGLESDIDVMGTSVHRNQYTFNVVEVKSNDRPSTRKKAHYQLRRHQKYLYREYGTNIRINLFYAYGDRHLPKGYRIEHFRSP